MAYLRNAWYVAAWASEVDKQLFHRTILGEPILIYRKGSGEAVAMLDRCPHRFVPLHLGRLIGDTVECGYHGLRYDCSGSCVANPFDGNIPRAAKVKTYPLAERYGILWVWMGNAEAAERESIPDFSYLDDPELAKVPGYKHVNAHYELLVDNLADLSHTHILHRSALGTDNPRGEHSVTQDGECVHSRFWYPGIKIPPLYAKHWDNADAIVDRWTEISWKPPSHVRLDAGVTLAGRPREEGLSAVGTHLFTPESETSTHYFYCHVRNFKVDDPGTDDAVRKWQLEAFHGEDAPMIEAQQRSMGSVTDLLSLKPILLASDAGAIRIRRVLAAKISKESQSTEITQGGLKLPPH